MALGFHWEHISGHKEEMKLKTLCKVTEVVMNTQKNTAGEKDLEMVEVDARPSPRP